MDRLITSRDGLDGTIDPASIEQTARCCPWSSICAMRGSARSLIAVRRDVDDPEPDMGLRDAGPGSRPTHSGSQLHPSDSTQSTLTLSPPCGNICIVSD